VLLVLGTSLGIGLVAQLEIRLPWTPVPITLQPLAVFLAGAALGSRRAAAAVGAYLVEGAAGLPFFAGGASGIAHLMGPTGGYLLGFLPAAFAIGFLAERGWDRSPWRAFASMFVQLAAFVPREQLLHAGLYPFLLGDLLKMVAAALLLPAAWKLVERAARTPNPGA
jgi:biotin transport system substrate-specific component